MRFPPEFLEEIRTRLPASEVVGRRVRLKKAGKEWKGLSPFNAEKTPSFYVNDGKMAWFDFSSGKNGNIFDFVMATEGLSFPEAVERLAGEAGLPAAAAHGRDCGAGQAAGRPPRGAGEGRRLLSTAPRRPRGRPGAGLPGAARHFGREPGHLPDRLCADRAACLARSPRRTRCRRHHHDRSRPARHRRRREGAGSTSSATGSCSRSATVRAG